MGYRSLIEINHDTFSRVDAEAFMADLRMFVSSGDAAQARRIEEQYEVCVISTRRSGDSYYVSRNKDGFPTQLPYDEELDAENERWSAAVEKAKAFLGERIKLRTIADLRAIISVLVSRLVDTRDTQRDPE